MSGRGETCRYFLQGNCRFGDRCRYYHPKGRGGRGDDRAKYQPPRKDSGPSFRQGGTNRFALFSDWEGDGDSSGRSSGSRDRYQQNYGGGGRNNYQDRYHYTNPNYKASQQERRGDGGGYVRGVEGRRRDGNDGDYSGGWRSGDRQDYRSGTSTSASEIVLTVQHDMQESMSMWPLTCYGYGTHVPHLPDLVDVSPEELRLDAYRATSSSSDTYLKNLEAMISQQTSLRTKYASLTQDQLDTISSGMAGDHGTGLFGSLTSSTSPVSGAPLGLFGPATTGAGLSGMGVQTSISLFSTSSTAGQNTMVSSNPVTSVFSSANQSSANPSLFAPPATPALASLSLFAPPASSNVPVSTSSSTVATSTTGTASKLNQQEIEAFKADRFLLGKIPETAPPPELC